MNYVQHFISGIFTILFLWGCVSQTDTEEERTKLLQTDGRNKTGSGECWWIWGTKALRPGKRREKIPDH
jgi:hypothetical protein